MEEEVDAILRLHFHLQIQLIRRAAPRRSLQRLLATRLVPLAHVDERGLHGENENAEQRRLQSSQVVIDLYMTRREQRDLELLVGITHQSVFLLDEVQQHGRVCVGQLLIHPHVYRDETQHAHFDHGHILHLVDEEVEMAVQAGIIILIQKVHGTGQVCRLLAVENTEDQIIEMAEFAPLIAFSKYVFEQRFLVVTC